MSSTRLPKRHDGEGEGDPGPYRPRKRRYSPEVNDPERSRDITPQDALFDLRGPGYKGDRLPRILERVAAGMPRSYAAASVGIDPGTLSDWCRKDDRVSKALQEAEARSIGVNLAYIQQAAQRGVWQAAAWLLERRWPQVFGQRVVADGSEDGEEEGEIIVRLSMDRAAASHQGRVPQAKRIGRWERDPEAPVSEDPPRRQAS